MNSETWIEPARGRRNAADGAKPASPSDSSDALQPWQLFTLAGLIGATAVVFVSRGHTPAGIVLLSLTIFAAAVAGVAAWRTLGPLVMPEDAGTTPILGGRTRAALEREKALVLRSIKELEFDRAMGKVAEKDFQEMGARLRARAARLIRQLDAGSNYREQISREIEHRLGAAGSSTARTATPAASVPQPARPAVTETAPAVKCPHCGTENDPDSQFCKRCGASLEPTE
jgi:hypothetical protein